ncbi:MAG: hydrolase [Alphaproteobacteria bacterium]
MLMERQQSCLLVVDVQERLLPSIRNKQQVVSNCRILLTAAARLGVPVLASEQYPKGLGPTVPELRPLLPEGAVLEKVEFSCAANRPYLERLKGLGRRQAVITGIEAHICVLQTALGLKAEGYDGFVVADAMGSRTPASHEAALARLRLAGIPAVTTEMVLFEWLGCAGTAEFKELSALIR